MSDISIKYYYLVFVKPYYYWDMRGNLLTSELCIPWFTPNGSGVRIPSRPPFQPQH